MSPRPDPANVKPLADLIRRVAAAQSARDISDALTELALATRGILIPAVRRHLRESYVGGPDGAIDDAEDILNQLLFKVAKSGAGFRGHSDGEAVKWLMTIATNLVLDSSKTPQRRLWLLRRRLVHNGYSQGAWNDPNDTQEPDHGFPDDQS